MRVAILDDDGTEIWSMDVHYIHEVEKEYGHGAVGDYILTEIRDAERMSPENNN